MQNIHWRKDVQESDLAAVRELTAKTAVFSPEEVGVAEELVEETLLHPEDLSYRFIFAEINNKVVAYTCYGDIIFTDQRFDLYWIAVHPDQQQLGIGKIILAKTEEAIRELQGKHIYAETAGKPEYLPTRKFYERNGYEKVAVLKDFYRDGDDKIIYCKVLL